MKTVKEYPATHSMSTSWFAVDLDGNVAIIEFDENGPVPVSVPESSEDEVIFDVFSNDKENVIATWPFTKEEVDEILATGYEVKKENEDHDLYSTVVKVDKSKFEVFYEIARDEQDDECPHTICIDKDRGLYWVDWYVGNNTTDAKIKDAVKSGIITPLKYLSTYQSPESRKDILRGYPFFVYRQDYDPYYPLKRTTVPKKPFTEDRLSKMARERALRLPVRFVESDKIQIAEHELSHVYAYEPIRYKGHEFVKYAMPNGTAAYIAESSIVFDGISVSGASDLQRAKEPTVLVAIDHDGIPYEDRISPEYYLSHSVFIAVSKFQQSKLEANIRFFNPHVILVSEGLIPWLEKTFTITDGMITVAGQGYPYFIWEERGQHITQIDSLAHMPFRGEPFQWVIPAEEIDRKK